MKSILEKATQAACRAFAAFVIDIMLNNPEASLWLAKQIEEKEQGEYGGEC